MFKAYGRYSSSYDEAVNQITLLKKDPNFEKLLKEVESKDKKNWTLETYLITPIQRICR